jgi:hypothetical protein
MRQSVTVCDLLLEPQKTQLLCTTITLLKAITNLLRLETKTQNVTLHSMISYCRCYFSVYNPQSIVERIFANFGYLPEKKRKECSVLIFEIALR